MRHLCYVKDRSVFESFVFLHCAMGEKTVKCCGNNFDFQLSDVRYNLQRSWLKTKRLKAKVFDEDR